MTNIEIENWFTYHAPYGDQFQRYEQIRDAAKLLARTIMRCTPVGPDQSAAIRKLRESVMTANASIACERAVMGTTCDTAQRPLSIGEQRAYEVDKLTAAQPRRD